MGKITGGGGGKIGNAHLKWAFSELACLFAREDEQAKRFLAKKSSKHNKAKALGILAARLGRAVYAMLRQKRAFDGQRFWGGRSRDRCAAAGEQHPAAGTGTTTPACDTTLSASAAGVSTRQARAQERQARERQAAPAPTTNKPRSPAVTARLRKRSRRVCQA